ncbi:MAG: FAD-binding protein [Micrococcales bacterium]|nr:FAD-binding protein [Micrococcales bacterium]
MDAGSNWAGNIRYAARELHRPTSIPELRRTVALSRGLRPLGSRHSFSAIADTPGDLVDVTALPREFELDEDAMTVTVNAGVRYGELAPTLDRAGFALSNLGSLPHITVGGATATGTHGSGDGNGTLSRQVAGLELVTVDGDLTRISRGDADFEGAVVHLGALGVVTRVTLDVVPRFTVRQDVYRGLSWGDVLEHFDELTSAAYSVSMFTSWAGEDFGDLWLKSTGELPEELYGVRPLAESVGLAGGESANTTRQGGVEGAWFERLPHFRLGFTPSNGEELQTEYLLPRARAQEGIRLIRELADRIAPQLLITELRTMAADDLWLSGAFGTDAVALHFTWKPHAEEVGALLPQLEERLLPLGARPHWGKLSAATDLAALYPRIDDFRALADRWDPRGKLRNRFLDRRLFS